MDMPLLNRELIRIGNRNGVTAEQISELFDLAENLSGHATADDWAEFMRPEYIYDFWKESYDEP